MLVFNVFRMFETSTFEFESRCPMALSVSVCASPTPLLTLKSVPNSDLGSDLLMDVVMEFTYGPSFRADERRNGWLLRPSALPIDERQVMDRTSP